MYKSFGHPLTNEREYIILLFLFYLINNTFITRIKLILCVTFIVHLYKLYRNYEINNIIHEDNYKYNYLFLLSLLLLINNDNYLLFSAIFIITGILYRKQIKDKYTSEEIIYHQDVFIIISSFILLIVYPNYRYNFVFVMEIINHSIILLE